MPIEKKLNKDGSIQYVARINTAEKIHREVFDTEDKARQYLVENNLYTGVLRYLTLDERQQIELHKDILSASKIASLIGRSKNCVVCELRRHGGKENYNAKKAHDHFLHNMKARHVGRKAPTDWEAPSVVRFRNIEMQLEILFEEIKNLKTIIKGQ